MAKQYVLERSVRKNGNASDIVVHLISHLANRAHGVRITVKGTLITQPRLPDVPDMRLKQNSNDLLLTFLLRIARPIKVVVVALANKIAV